MEDNFKWNVQGSIPWPQIHFAKLEDFAHSAVEEWLAIQPTFKELNKSGDWLTHMYLIVRLIVKWLRVFIIL